MDQIKIMFVSLGCDKNLVDTEVMMGLLAAGGYAFTNEETEADVFIVNSCCFIGDAKEESIQTILELAQYKENGRAKALIVTGCLAQRYAKEIEEELPEVDAIVGTTAYDEIAAVIEKTLAGNHTVQMEDLQRLPRVQTRRMVTTGGHFAYLKIAEGCNKRCTYCVIPSVRGNYRSVPMEELVEQAKQLAEEGVKELILVAQETSMYGIDLYGEKRLPQLLKALCAIPQLVWIRILYCYPEEITPELVQTMKTEPKICHYLDLPIQHCSDDILRRMGRATNKQELTERIAYLRREIPDITLRTTLITGFPGETQAQFEEMMAFVDEMEFDRLGVFPYSPEEGTPAAVMPDQIDEETKLQRRDALMELQQEVSLDKCQEMIGRTLTVLIEGEMPEEHTYVARTYRDAPDVDGYLFVQTDEQLLTGDIARVRVTGALEYDLIGELLTQEERKGNQS